VAVEVSSIGAICRSRSDSPSECLPTSALSRMRARLSILAEALPAEMSLCNCSRSSSVSSTTYFFTVALLRRADLQDRATYLRHQIIVDRGLVCGAKCPYLWKNSGKALRAAPLSPFGLMRPAVLPAFERSALSCGPIFPTLPTCPQPFVSVIKTYIQPEGTTLSTLICAPQSPVPSAAKSTILARTTSQ
jgi:hypothetical protein